MTTTFKAKVNTYTVKTEFNTEGQCHCETGPACRNPGLDHYEYWLDGKSYSQRDFYREMLKRNERDLFAGMEVAKENGKLKLTDGHFLVRLTRDSIVDSERVAIANGLVRLARLGA